MINVGILGVTGYAGIELLKILCSHSEVNVSYLGSRSNAGAIISEIYPDLNGVCDLPLEEVNVEKIAQNCDLVFTLTSDEATLKLYNKGIKIIDLSGDYRYDDAEVYEKWYNKAHRNPELLKESVYGLPEIYKEKIKNATLIGNPGCYALTSVLGAAPLIKNGFVSPQNIIIDSKIGVTQGYAESIKAYKIATHSQTLEIEQEYSKFAGKPVMVSFTPHLISEKRGIYSTIYMNLTDDYTDEQLLDVFKVFYKDCPFIRICDKDKIPELNYVVGSGFIDIGLKVDKRLRRVVVIATSDNLVGHAVLNMNIMFGLDEMTGL